MHSLPCMDPWPSFIFMLRAHLTLALNFGFSLTTSSRASEGPLRYRSWTFESSRITCHHVGYIRLCWISFIFFVTIRRNHMFSSSSPPNPPTYSHLNTQSWRFTNMPQLQTRWPRFTDLEAGDAKKLAPTKLFRETIWCKPEFFFFLSKCHGMSWICMMHGAEHSNLLFFGSRPEIHLSCEVRPR